MDKQKFTVIEGGRPDDDSAIITHLSDLAHALRSTRRPISARAEQIRMKLADDVLADKYVRYVLHKLGSALPTSVERDWAPAFLTLMEVIPDNKGPKMVAAAIKESPIAYDSTDARRMIQKWEALDKQRKK